jgi:hypothetical protein
MKVIDWQKIVKMDPLWRRRVIEGKDPPPYKEESDDIRGRREGRRVVSDNSVGSREAVHKGRGDKS